ncbi:hypothetical protein M758_12G017000 [Ceratodon purpureus]|nr:hypothetical protein M758_12G017000 [Ceratodon purpureus]
MMRFVAPTWLLLRRDLPVFCAFLVMDSLGVVPCWETKLEQKCDTSMIGDSRQPAI